MSLLSQAFTRQKLCIDFLTLKSTAPKGIYVAPHPSEPLVWTGVLFVRKGPYANAVLRFQIEFPVDYPRRPPVVTFRSDLFHPLVTPLTTYTYSTRDFGADTVSAADEQRLPPGGLSLRHGFPEWFQHAREGAVKAELKESASEKHADAQELAARAQANEDASVLSQRSPHVVELLQYLRIVFDTEEVLDAIPLDAAANTGAWHAWKTYRSKAAPARATASVAPATGDSSEAGKERSLSPRQQPGGARRPGEWNWQGVWEDRVRKSIQASVSEQVLFGGDSNDVISFLKMDQDAVNQVSPLPKMETAQ